jgi:hypothetical protein
MMPRNLVNQTFQELCITGEKWFASGESKILSRGEAIFQRSRFMKLP